MVERDPGSNSLLIYAQITKMGAKPHTPSDFTRLLFLEIVPTLVYMSAEQPQLFGSEGLVHLFSSPVQLEQTFQKQSSKVDGKSLARFQPTKCTRNRIQTTLQGGSAKVRPILLLTYLNAQVKFNDFWPSDEQY